MGFDTSASILSELRQTIGRLKLYALERHRQLRTDDWRFVSNLASEIRMCVDAYEVKLDYERHIEDLEV